MTTNPNPEGTPSGDSNHARRVRNAALAGRLVSAVGADDPDGVNTVIHEIFDGDIEGVLLALAALACTDRSQKFLDQYALTALDAKEELGVLDQIAQLEQALRDDAAGTSGEHGADDDR